MIVTAGATNRFIYFYIQEDAGASNPGEPVTGLVFSSLDSASYARAGGVRVAITLKTLSAADAVYDAGGFILVDDTNMAGTYRLDVPDAAFATGVDQVVIQIDPGATRVCAPVLVDITDVDLRDAVRGGMTALPNVDAGSAGGVATDTDANGAVRIVDGTGARELNTNVGAVALVDVVTTLTGHTAQTADHTAGIADIPTVSEFNARTLVAASYALEATVAALNDISTADLATALTDIHLDHLLAVNYDPAAKPGVATALFNELIENNAGVSRLTAAALTQAWAVATRVLTANTNLNDPTAAAISTAVHDELTATARTGGSYGQLHKDNLDAKVSLTALATALATAQADLNIITDADGVILGAAGVDKIYDEAIEDHDTQGNMGWGAALSVYAGSDGPGIYVDSGAANTNTVVGTDGTEINPVSTLAAARTLADALGLKIYYMEGNSDITVAATHEDWEFIGIGSIRDNIINLGSQDVDRSLFRNLTIEGTQGGTGRITARDCALQDPGAGVTTLHIFAERCGIVDDISVDTSADNVFDECYSLAASGVAPIITATGAAGSIILSHWGGKIELKSLSASHNIELDGSGHVTFNADCNVNASIDIHGVWDVTDNTAGMSDLTAMPGLVNMTKINAEIDKALNTAIPGGPTADSINERVAALDDLLQAAGAGDAAAIKTEADKIALVDAGAGVAGSVIEEVENRAIPGDAMDLITDALDLFAVATSGADEIRDSIKNRVITLPGQVAPPLGPTEDELLGWLYKVVRNRKRQSATLWELYADDESTVDAKATISDDGSLAIVQEIEVGP